MNVARWLFVWVCLWAGAGMGVVCQSCRASAPKPPVFVVGMPDASFPDDCAASCFVWRRADCPEGQLEPGGGSCEDVCRNAALAGIDSAKQLSCASIATSCAAIRACPF